MSLRACGLGWFIFLVMRVCIWVVSADEVEMISLPMYSSLVLMARMLRKLSCRLLSTISNCSCQLKGVHCYGISLFPI